jgi:hypothetical protein
MPQPPTLYRPITTAPDDLGLTQQSIDREKLARDEENARKARQAALDAHLSGFADDPVSKALATADFVLKEEEAQKAAAQKEYDDIVSKHDDPVMKAWAVAEHYAKKTDAPEAQKAFADRERLEMLREQEKNAATLDRAGRYGMGVADAFVRETIGSAVNVVPDLAAVVARLKGEQDVATQLNRDSQEFGQAREQSRSGDMSPWLSRMYGGASQSLLQTAATPGGAASKIIGAGVMSGNQAITAAEDAGLEGAAKYRYVGSQALFESGVAAIGQKFFGGGIESRLAGQTVAAQTWKALAKNIGTDALKEMPEEVVTTILQDVSSKLEGVSPDMNFADFVTNATEAAVQAAMMAPMANAGNAAALAFRQKPSKQNYDAAVSAGMPPIDNPNREGRTKYAADLEAAAQKQPAPEPTKKEGDGIPAPSEVTPEQATLEPTAPAANPDNAPDTEYDEILNLLQKGDPNEAKDQTGQAPEASAEGQGQAEGLLTKPPAETQEQPTPADSQENRESPAAQNTAEASPVATGEPSPDQSSKEAGPVSDSGTAADPLARFRDPRDKAFEKLIRLKSARDMGDGIYYFDEDAMTPQRRQSLKTESERQRLLGRIDPTQLFEFKPWAEVTGDKYAKGYAILDRRQRILDRELKGATAAQQDEPVSKPQTAPERESSNPPAETSPETSLPRRGIIGDMLTSGEVVQTSSGRSTTPFPKIALDTKRKLSMTLRKAEEWLQSNALAEAEARGDEFNAQQFRNEKPGKMPKATKDSMEEYLFGEQPAVVPSILKPMGSASPAPIEIIESPDLRIARKADEDIQARKKAIQDGGFVSGDQVTQVSTGRKGVLESISDKTGFVAVRFKDGSVLGTDVSGFIRGAKSPAAKPKPKAAAKPVTPANPNSLRSIVLAQGGISTKALRKDYNLNELKANGLLGIMRIQGLPVDIMAQTLESSGDLRTPADRTPADWLMDQLQSNADGARATYSDEEIGKRLEAEREAYERVKAIEDERIDKAGIEELRQRSEEAGIRAADEGEGDEGFSEAEANELIDTSFDFGANVEAKADDESFTLSRPKPPKPKAPDFGTNENTKQTALFDNGKKGELPGQNLLFNTDPGDLQNPNTQENKTPKPATPAAESDIKAAMRAELARQAAEEAAAKPAAAPKKPSKPRKPRTATGQKLEKMSEDTGKAAKKAIDDFLKEMGDLGVLSGLGINNKALVATAKMVRAQIADGVVKFADFVARFVEATSPETARKLSAYLEAAWEISGETDSRLDPAGKVADVLGTDTQADTETAWASIPGYFAEQLLKGETYKSITEARSEASDIVGYTIKPGTAEAKRLDELIEYGIVQAGRKIVADGGTPGSIFDKLVDLYKRQPTLGVRDSNSMEMQAYSTPVPLAYLVSQLGHVTKSTTVFEPTAGNGMLLIGTAIENAYANELDPDRAKTLRDQGFRVTENNAATMTSPRVQVVLANPPFGKTKDENRNTVEFTVDGYKTTEIDHAIALQSLKGMERDGYTVLIIAAKGHNAKDQMERRQAYSRGKDRPFYDALYQGYDVTSHTTVDGSLYSRQGASFPVDVIVLRPLGTVRADKKRSTPWAIVPRIFTTWQEMKDAFNELADDGDGAGVLTGNGDSGSPDLSPRNQDDMGRLSGQNENPAAMAEGEVRPTESESVVSAPVVGKGKRGRGGKKSGGSRAESGLSGDAATERSGTVDVPTSSETNAGRQGVDSGTGSDRVAGTGTAESGDVAPESHQSSYTPSSKNKSVDTLIPTNLQDATQRALEVIEDTYGPVDTFVQKELGYRKGDKYFTDLSAEQVDALALAIHAHKNGGGMIVGDMTGVGKGRVAAAMMRYADRNGLVPVFVTEKPDLFGDMYRDLADVGSDTDDTPFFALITNNASGAASIDLPNGRKLNTSKETNAARFSEGLSSLRDGNGFTAVIDGVPTKMNAVFTMYSQLQTVNGNETQRRQQLRDLMPNAYLILDESHNAGGTVKERVNEDAPPDRAAFTRELVQSGAGAMYLSATFAKRPDVMDLYSKTDMAKAVDGDVTKLAEVIKAGGLPLQQVVSAMLSERGQYIRREKSFEGVSFEKVDVGVNLEEQDKITDVFRGIRRLDAVVSKVVEDMAEELTSAGEAGFAGDVSTGDAGITSTSFSSILWNAVDQMLFALKADKAADQAIQAWKNGEVPILAVDNTMESILDEYVKENNLKTGDVVNLSFKDILQRYLERSRWITIDTGMRTERNKKITRKERLTDDQLNVETELGNALTLFNDAAAQIAATEIDAPASPIDWLRHRMEKAGMKIAEITGRKSMLVYSDNNVARLGVRPRAEAGTKGKQETIRKINGGTLDGVILNRSGATGVSIHASAKFKNQKPRHMIIVQPAKNIDEFMQMLGRVNRTGQVVKPRYSLAMSDSPSELRPAAVLSKKLASLNASVTAKSKGAVGFDVTDVMNQVGGQIVSEYLFEHPELAQALEMDDVEPREDGSEAEVLEDIVRKATGRAAILPIEQQREFWDDITALYNARIEELDALNANPLVAKTLDLDAKTISSVNLFKGKPDEGPFAAPAEMERMDVRNPGKPMTPEQVTSRILEFYGVDTMDQRWGAEIKWVKDTVASMRQDMIQFRRDAVARFVNPDAVRARETVIDEQANKVENAINEFSPGTVVNLVAEGQPFVGVVVGFTRTGKSPNPVAPSRWMIEVAINDAAKKLTIPVSRSDGLSATSQSMDSVLDTFRTMQTQSREKRWMGTGNLMAAFAQLSLSNGKLVFYTDDQGNTNRGILMPRTFNAATFLEGKSVQFDNSAAVLQFFDRGGKRISSIDNNLTIVNYTTAIRLVSPRARSRGGKYTLNQGILAAAGGAQFVSVGNQMVLRSDSREQQRRILDAVLAVTPLKVPSGQDHALARDVVGIPDVGAPDTVAEPEPESELRKSAREAREAVDAQKAENDRQNKIIAAELRKTNLGSGAPISDELAKAVATRMIGAIRLGVKQFDAFIKELRANLAEADVTGLKPTLIRTWNAIREKHGLDEATDAGFDAAMTDTVDVDVEQAIEAVKGEPAASVAEPVSTYSTKNAFSAEARERLDMGERPPVTPQPREPSVTLAEEIGRTAAGRERIDLLIGELMATPRAVTPLENDLLNFRNAELGNKLDAALRKQIDSRKNGDSAQEAVAEREAIVFRKQKQDLIEMVLEPIGTAAGRALQARKAVINQDYTLERLSLEYEAAYGEAPNTAKLAEMQKQIDDLNASIKELERQLAEESAKNEDLETRLKDAHDTAVQDTKPAAPPKKATVLERLAKEGKEQVESGFKKLSAMLGKVYSIEGAAADLTEALIEIATGYSKQGVVRLADFLNRVGKRMGPKAKEIQAELISAWNTVRGNSTMTEQEQITNKIDILDPDTIGRAARDLHRFVIERDGLDASAEGREAAVVAVHAILVDILPDITRDEVARAMSGIGIYSELNKDDIEVIRRDQKAQLLSLQQIEDWMKGIAPPATGQERPPVSDEQRLLRRMVNEAKKAAGLVTTTEGQLRSALDAAKRMARNRIADLTKAIESGTRIERSRRVLEDPSGELQTLQAERDALQKLYNEAFGKPELSDAQKLNRAEKALDRAISNLESDLKAGKLYDDAPKAPVTSPEIDAKRAALAALKASREEMRLQSGEAQARSDAAYERLLKQREADLAQRLADGDFAPPGKKPERKFTPEMLKTMQSIAKQRQELKKQSDAWVFENRHIVYKAYMKGPVAGAHMLRKLLTTLDQSLIGRQGWLLGLTHPKIYAKSARQAFASNPVQARSMFPTEQDLFNTQAALDADANWVRLEKIGKLAVTDVHGGINREEDSRFVPEWFDKVWGIGGSERAGSAFINTQRRLVFRNLVSKLSTKLDGKNASLSNADLRVIGNLVNVASGRGGIGKWTGALDALTLVFFSPRWWVSRLSWWVGQPVWHDSRWFGGDGASTEVRQMAAAEWAKQAAAQIAVMGVAVAGLTAAFGAGGDDEEWEYYVDPRSPNFGRIRIGNTRIDMTAGLGQHLSLMSRLATGTQVDRWETKDVDKADLVGKHLRGKLAPVPSAFWDYLEGQSIGGEKFGTKEWIRDHSLPLIFQEANTAIKEEGAFTGGLLSAWMFFGGTAQTYEARVKSRVDITNELRAMKKQGKSPEQIQATLNKHLAHMAGLEAKDHVRTANPEEAAALQTVIKGESSPELLAAIQKEKYDIILNASGRVSSDPKRIHDDKGFTGSDDASRRSARSLVKTMIPDVNEAIDLYEDAYRARNNSIYEKNGKMKAAVWAGRARIRSIYAAE